MATLQEQLLTAAKRPGLVRDCSKLIDEEVDKKSGLSGLAIKAAFKIVKAVKPGFVDGVINLLLDDWVGKLEGHYVNFVAAGQGTFGGFVARDAGNVAEKLLEVTDARAKRADNRTVVATYQRLRPNAKDYVTTAIPGLGRVVDRHLAAG